MTRNNTLAAMLALLLVPALAHAEPAQVEEGFTPLFNGSDLSGWEGNPELWSVRDGAITGETSADKPLQKNTYLIYRGGELADFELRLQYRIVAGNSGIQYRSKEVGQWHVSGYQADMEAGKNYSGILYEDGGRGFLARRGQKVHITPDGKINVVGSVGDSNEIQAQIKSEDWNDYVVIARGHHLVHAINGRVTIDCVDESPRFAAVGLLALQVHKGPPMTVQYRHIRVKKLDPTEP